uniref:SPOROCYTELESS-like EAR-containing protein 2 n=1 Tax=Kalanchoe fedtschenkoi TaxID=63787 RepID=A0A7N0SY00_KALFE
MSDEEQIRNSSSSSSISFRNGGNGRNSKKPKPKKIPQRGLGVAQLEKIRLKEEVKNEALTSPPHPMTAASLHNRSLTVPPFPQHTRPYPFGTDTLHGHVPCHPHLPVRHHGIGPPLAGTQFNNGVAGIGYPSRIFSGHIQEVEKETLSLNPPCTSDGPFRGTSGNQQSYSYSSAVNVGPGNSSSAVLNLPTEPPSNQSPLGTYRSFQPEESEKIAGLKRPCPFMIRDPSDPMLHGKFNPLTVHGLEISTSFGYPGSSAINGNFGHREGLPCSMSVPELHRTYDFRTDWATPEGDFLKIAPPALPSSKTKHAHCAELLELGSVHSQAVHAQDSNSVQESNSSIQHLHNQHQQQRWRPCHNFFPAPNNARHGQPADGSNRVRNGEAEDHVDLNLKL